MNKLIIILLFAAYNLVAQVWYTPTINSGGQLGPSSTNLFWTNLFAGTNIFITFGTNGEAKIHITGFTTNTYIKIQQGNGNSNIFTNFTVVGSAGLIVGLQSSDSLLWFYNDSIGEEYKAFYDDGTGNLHLSGDGGGSATILDNTLYGNGGGLTNLPAANNTRFQPSNSKLTNLVNNPINSYTNQLLVNFQNMGISNLLAASGITLGTNNGVLWITNTANYTVATNGANTNMVIYNGSGAASFNLLLQGNGANNSGSDYLKAQDVGGVKFNLQSNGVFYILGITNNGTMDSLGLMQAFGGLNSYTNVSVNDKGNNSNRVQLLTGKQGLTVDNTNDDAGNYERGFMRWSANVLTVGTEAGGAGVNRQFNLSVPSSKSFSFLVGGVQQWNLDSSELYPNTDNTRDIGLAGTTPERIRNVYLAGTLSGQVESSDTSTKSNLIISGSSYPGATSVVNGGQLILSGGLSPSRIAVTNWNMFTNSIITNVIVTVDGTFTQFLTNGAASGMWTNGADLSTCATNIATNCNSKVFFGTSIAMSTYVTVSAFQSNVLFFPLAKCLSITTGSVTNGATNISSTANSVNIPNSVLNVQKTLNAATNQANYNLTSGVITTGQFWTNTTGARVILSVNYTLTDTVSGEPSLNMTNVTSGQWFVATNSAAVATIYTGQATFFVSTNEYFIATNKSTGTATTSVDASWAVKN